MGHLDTGMLHDIFSRATVKPKIFVETGLYRGDQIVVAEKTGLFERVLGVELSETFANHTRARLKASALGPFTIIQGDSREVLPTLIQRYANEPVMWCLDAHYCATTPPIPRTPFPLWDELIALRARTCPDIIVVDDVHTFGKGRPDLRFDRSVPEWEGVTVWSLESFLGCKGEEIGDGFVMWRNMP